jgi:hypothetical protein
MQHIIGIDFSGGVSAGRKIWIARGRVENNVLVIETCVRGEALPGSGRERTACLAALRAFLQSTGDAIIGVDFPLGLPRELMRGQTWLQFLHAFAGRFATPQHFRQACWRAARGRELKRRTDIEAKTPFSPYNLRLYRQTYFGLRDVIAPLVQERSVRVLPMQTSRSTILRSLQREGVQLAGWLEPIVLADPEGDALDSIVAAWAAYRALPQLDRMPRALLYRQEGCVFI